MILLVWIFRSTKKNPILLYMHERGKAIGHMQDVTLESNGDVTGYPFLVIKMILQ